MSEDPLSDMPACYTDYTDSPEFMPICYTFRTYNPDFRKAPGEYLRSRGLVLGDDNTNATKGFWGHPKYPVTIRPSIHEGQFNVVGPKIIVQQALEELELDDVANFERPGVWIGIR